MGEAGEVLVVVLLDHVDHEGGEDEDEEADVERGDELLPVGVHHRAQQLPRPAPPAETGVSTSSTLVLLIAPVHAHHAQYLEEAETPERRGGVDPPAQPGQHNQRGTGGGTLGHWPLCVG